MQVGKSTWIAAHGSTELESETIVFFDDLLQLAEIHVPFFGQKQVPRNGLRYTARHRTQFLQNLSKYKIEVPVEIVAIDAWWQQAY